MDGTAGGTLTLRSLHFFRGRDYTGGGLFIKNDATFVVELTLFSECQAIGSYDGGGAIMA